MFHWIRLLFFFFFLYMVSEHRLFRVCDFSFLAAWVRVLFTWTVNEGDFGRSVLFWTSPRDTRHLNGCAPRRRTNPSRPLRHQSCHAPPSLIYAPPESAAFHRREFAVRFWSVSGLHLAVWSPWWGYLVVAFLFVGISLDFLFWSFIVFNGWRKGGCSVW